MRMFTALLLLSVLLAAGGTAYAQVFVPKLTLTWTDKSTNELGFALERGLLPAGPFTEVATVAANIVTYVDTTVAVATVYCYRLRGFTERTVNSKVERQHTAYSNIQCGSAAPAPDGSPTNLLLSAQQSLGAAQEQLSNAQARIAQYLQQN